MPWGFWYSISSPFSRLAVGTPHHQIANIIFILGLLFISRIEDMPSFIKKSVGFVLLSFFLLISSPTYFILFWLSYLFSVFIYVLLLSVKLGYLPKFMEKIHFSGKKKTVEDIKQMVSDFIVPVLPAVLVSLLLAIFIKNRFMSSPTMENVKLWDLAHYYRPPLKLFLYASGSLVLVAPFSLLYYLRKITFRRLVFLSVLILSFFLALVSIKGYPANIYRLFGFHNLRFFTSSAYIVLGVALVEFLFRILKKRIVFLSAVVFLIFFNFIHLYVTWRGNFKGPYTASYLHSMPKDMYLGLKILEKEKGEGVVLTSVSSTLGVAVPAISGKRVFLGRSIFTFDLGDRQAEAKDFYLLKMTQDQAKKFLERENIEFIAVTHFDIKAEKLHKYYPFLVKFVDNPHLVIFRYRK